MAYDGLVNYSIVKELKNKIINGKIDKIFEPNSEEIILGIYSNGVKYALELVISSNYYRVNLTTKSKQNPSEAPNFCMTLRKYLLGTHITNIYTNGLERIIFIEFEGFNKTKDFSKKILIIELMGKHSNIILVNNENIIIDALKHFSINSGSLRNIYIGAKYELPKSDKLDFFEIKDENDFYNVLKNNSIRLNSNSLINIISNTFTGMSKTSISSFEKVLEICDEFNINSVKALFSYISKTIFENNVIGNLFENNYSLKIASNKEDLQLNFFLDDYYFEREVNTNFINYRNNLLKLILIKLSKLNNKLDLINKKITECNDAEKYKLYGELITSNLYRINDYHTDSITLENYYDNNKEITILLDKSITPSSNAKNFFKKYKKLKIAQEYVNNQKTSILNDINYIESVIYEINSSNTIDDMDDIYSEIQENEIGILKNKSKQNKKIKHTSKKSPNKIGELLKYDIDGFTVLIGKNNKQNDYITTKLANKEDLWFHVKDFHGSHVVLRTENKTPSSETLYKCACLAKEHSKAKQSSNVPVDYTYVKFVRKPSGSKPGMVAYSNNKTIYI
mgnify:FL=1